MAFAYLVSKHGLHYFQQDQTIFIGPPTELAELQKILKNTSRQSSLIIPQQVLIEARIVEADYRFARNLGVKLGHQQALNSQLQTNSSIDLSAGGLNGFEAPVTTITMLRKGASSILDFELSALESDGNGNIIANPRIITANKTLATIEQGTELPYQSNSKEGSKVQFRKANLKLEVTPTINHQHILLDVEISKDSVGMKTEQGFAINTKHLKSQILVENGGTVVIGGIYLQTERDDIVKVPLLGDIPILGKFFQHQSTLKDKTELLVFLTPSLIDAQGNNSGANK
jgi:type IV pilus assembly protein PilQ